MLNLGLGDDQDADGWQTGYKAWEPQLWKALGVDSVTVTEAEPEPITNEHIKVASNYCLLYTSQSPRDVEESRMPSSA